MPFTAGEITNIAAASTDYFFNKGDTFKQALQDKPLVALLERKAKTFPGGKGDISISLKGAYGDGSGNDVLKGYTHDMPVQFYTPANLEKAKYPWRETHIGLTLTHTELKIDGLSVVDTNGERVKSHSRREMTVLVGLLKDKLEDLAEQYLRSLDDMFHGDGVADPLGFIGLQALIPANPSVGTVGGLSASRTWWRNRAATAANAAAGGQGAITSSPTEGGTLATFLQKEYRQLRRYGGKPDTILAGSDFIGAMERELRANGSYSDSGFNSGVDFGVGEMKFKGTGVQYDPWLDSNGLSKRAYFFDSSNIFLMKMEDEWRREHSPARPPEKFVLFRSITSTGQLVAARRNTSLVVDIA